MEAPEAPQPGQESPAASEPEPWAWLWRYPWVVVAAPVAIFVKGLLGISLYAPGDGGQIFIPWFLVSARSWLSGHLPTWNPWAQAGMPLLGSSQAGVLYPPNLLFIVAPYVIANNIGIATSFVVAGLGAWLLARQLCRDAVAAAVGGLGFGVCTFLFAHIGHQSMIAGACWLPWMLFGYELVRERFSAARLFVPAAAVALAALAGHSQIFFMDLLAFGLYVVAGEILGGRDRHLGRALVSALAVAAGLGLAAVQLLPTIIVARASVRTTLPFVQAMSFSLPKNQLAMLLFPYLFGKTIPGGPYAVTYGGIYNLTELSGYPGMALLVLAVVGLLALRRHRGARAILVVGVFSVLMALGPATPLSHWFFRIPVYGQFRAWGRYIYGLDLAVAVLAAYGTAVLRRATARQRRVALGLAAATAGAVVATALVVPDLSSVHRLIPGGHARTAALAVPCAFALAGIACVALLAWTRRIGPLVVVAVVVADSFFSFAGFYEWRQMSPSIPTYTAEISAASPNGWGPVATEPGGIARYLYIGPDTSPVGADFVDITDARGMRSVNANNVLMSSDYAAATEMAEDGGVNPSKDIWGFASHVLDLLRVTTVVLNPPFAAGGPPAGSLLSNPQNAGGGLVRYTYQPRLPEAFVVGDALHVTFAQAMVAIHGGVPFDPSTIALVDKACAACPTGAAGAAGSSGPVTWGTDWATMTVTASRPGMLVLSQAWSPGWVASVGDRTIPVVQVDGLVQGVPVPAGISHVRFSYHAPGLKPGFLVTLATLVAFAGLGTIEAILRHRRRLARTAHPRNYSSRHERR
jgi:hypothetical protein